MTHTALACTIGLNTTIELFCFQPGAYTPEWVQGHILEPLHQQFPNKTNQIRLLADCIAEQRQLHLDRKRQKRPEKLFKRLGETLCKMREVCGLDANTICEYIQMPEDTRNNIYNIERGIKVDVELCKQAIECLLPFYKDLYASKILKESLTNAEIRKLKDTFKSKYLRKITTIQKNLEKLIP